MVNAGLVLKSIEQNNVYSSTLLLAAGLQIWYALDFLWFEDGFPTSFDVMYEGTGYMLTLAYDIYPFIPTTITRFLLVYRFVITSFYLCRGIISFTLILSFHCLSFILRHVKFLYEFISILTASELFVYVLMYVCIVRL